ncbi:MAG: transposase [Deltaproteobacteria bacterium]|nr:transposase [Deltaproteobacteria bacterium]MBL7083860.1 transposase [Candidatus Aminicenantes bacterium]
MAFLKAVAGKEITPGIIAVIQSFGSQINLHPHLHFLLRLPSMNF